MSSGGSTGGPRILLIASAGGHLGQLLELRPWWSRYERVWVTFDKADARSRLAGEQIVYAYHPTTRNIRVALRNLVLAVGLLRRLRPDLLVSTGAGVAYPLFLVARLMRIPLLYVEVYDRTDTLTGRLCHPLVSAFAAQWPQQVERYPGAELVGPVL